MKILFDPDFYRQYKKINVRIQHKVDELIDLFRKNPQDPQLSNHLLHEPYQGLRSIDITVDYRALYQEVKVGEKDIVAYFVVLGTHDQLYGKIN